MWVARSLAIQSSCRKFRVFESLLVLGVFVVVVVWFLVFCGFVCSVSVCNENLEIRTFLSQTTDSV